ncbi:hypothetical protein JZ751_018765 [Albula glossodonta]|uniref:Synaptobrevin-like 1 n=1 Tax=Albula glossodonta TaxID=121402 RepID=A0A8T2NRF1_9TELE|nr:hypothetical protein JZ751_018765 [Albula glossodonta]
MAILFAVVARGTTILAKHAWCGGNFLEVTEQILAKIPSENNKLTYSHGSYLFHYICHDRIIYLCITDDDFERSRAFTFLSEVKKRFQTTYGSRAQTALPYAMNSEFSSAIAAQMKYHSDARGPDRVAETQVQVDDLKGIMVRNIDQLLPGDGDGKEGEQCSEYLVAQRGEKLELLIDKTENLVDSSVTFKTTSRNLARAMCMKNLKLTIILASVVIVSGALHNHFSCMWGPQLAQLCEEVTKEGWERRLKGRRSHTPALARSRPGSGAQGEPTTVKTRYLNCEPHLPSSCFCHSSFVVCPLSVHFSLWGREKAKVRAP